MRRFKRFHQLRTNPIIRDQHSEYQIQMDDIIWPLFVQEGQNICSPIPSLHGISRWSPDRIHEPAAFAHALGVNKLLLFPVIDPETKNPTGSRSSDPYGPVPLAIKILRASCPDMTLIADVCLCAYTDHGHCGILDHDLAGNSETRIDNDKSIELLAASACCLAEAGAHIIAPSAMMDGQVSAIHSAFQGAPYASDIQIMGYSAKYSSCLYGPFRDAAKSAPGHGDRHSYQMDYRNRSQALAEIEADIEEGADMIMVKPATWYQDILYQARMNYPGHRLAAYHVSGEYMLLKHGASHGLFDFTQAYMETLTGIKRAGADWIITYGIQEIANAKNS